MSPRLLGDRRAKYKAAQVGSYADGTNGLGLPTVHRLGAIASEREWQATVVATARAFGWRVYHTLNSKGSAAGYPDLTLVRGGVIVFAELKTDTGRVSRAQQEWVDQLNFAAIGSSGAVRACVWRPCVWPEVLRVLAPEGADVRGDGVRIVGS